MIIDNVDTEPGTRSQSNRNTGCSEGRLVTTARMVLKLPECFNSTLAEPGDREVKRLLINQRKLHYINMAEETLHPRGWILMKNMSDNFLKNWQPMFPPDKLVKMFVLQTDPKVELSMKLSELRNGTPKEEEENQEEVQRRFNDERMCDVD